MEEELNIRKVYNNELREICCGCVLLSEENLREMHRYWEITELAKTFLRFATYLEGFDQMLDKLYEPVRRMTDCVFDHPRLRLQLLRLQLVVVQRLGCLHDHELSVEQDVTTEIARYERNIALADAYRFDEVENRKRSGLRYDPIEWSRAYEETIDEVSREVDAALASHPRGMGFCFAHWHAKEQALRARGIAWQNPHVLNPRVLFD